MEPKKYSSYKQIEQELEILKIQKEIDYKKMLLSVEKTKDSILPSNPVSKIGNLTYKFLSGNYGTILKLILPIAVNMFTNKKRGN